MHLSQKIPYAGFSHRRSHISFSDPGQGRSQDFRIEGVKGKIFEPEATPTN
jgi:hypothetical protein